MSCWFIHMLQIMIETNETIRFWIDISIWVNAFHLTHALDISVYRFYVLCYLLYPWKCSCNFAQFKTLNRKLHETAGIQFKLRAELNFNPFQLKLIYISIVIIFEWFIYSAISANLREIDEFQTSQKTQWCEFGSTERAYSHLKCRDGGETLNENKKALNENETVLCYF